MNGNIKGKESMRGKRKLDCLMEKKELDEKKQKDSIQIKGTIEFENDEEFEKSLLSSFKKKKDASEYIFSDIVKKLYGELKKYKSIYEMADEIKKLSIHCISNNLEIICNNECTSSFFIENFRVKYINEQNKLNIKCAQNYFREFMVLYKNNDFDDFNLEIDTNVGENKSEAVGTDEKEVDEGVEMRTETETEAEGKIGETNEEDDISFLTNENFYSSDSWKEKIKFKIHNINDNNVLFKILKYFHSITVRIENISSKINKFDIVKTLHDINMSILNMNMWDVYVTKPNRSVEFFRKAILYVQNKDDCTKLVNLFRDSGSKTKEGIYGFSLNANKNSSGDNDKDSSMSNIKNWKFEVKKNIYNYMEIRVCPPICSHKKIIAQDYEYAKQLVNKLDKCCNINKSLLHEEEETVSGGPTKKRKTENSVSKDEELTKDGEDKAEEDGHNDGHNDGQIAGHTDAKVDGKADEKNETLDETPDETPNEKKKFDSKGEGEGEGEGDDNNNEDSFMVKLVESNKKINVSKKLDILILYLRFVHNFCFYSAKKFHTYDEMVRECGHFFLRVNLDKEQPHNLTPTYYENFDVVKLICDNGEDPEKIKNRIFTIIEKRNRMVDTDVNGKCNGDDSSTLKEENSFSHYQLRWRSNFEKELMDALQMNYYENIDIEKTEEFLDILKKKYILNVNNTNEIRCAKCKKLFSSIRDVPNHIFMKHVQAKLQLITETEIEIMKRKFFEAPHSFHFLHMMEKKYNSILQQNNSGKGVNQKRNRNIHFVGRKSKVDLKQEGNFDGKGYYANLYTPFNPPLKNEKFNSTKKIDFYDDT